MDNNQNMNNDGDMNPNNNQSININRDIKPKTNNKFVFIVSLITAILVVGIFVYNNQSKSNSTRPTSTSSDSIARESDNNINRNAYNNAYSKPTSETEKTQETNITNETIVENKTIIDESDEEDEIIYGIAVKDFNAYKHEKSSLAENATVEIKNDSIILTTYEMDEEPNTITHKVSNVTKAVASCDGCGSGCYLYYINNKNELHEINFDNDRKDTLIKSSVKDIETEYIMHGGFCSYDTVVITNTDNTKSVYAYGFDTYLSYEEMNKEYFTTGDSGSEDEGPIIFIANPELIRANNAKLVYQVFYLQHKL